ncbi:hypothetical protein SD305_07700 [Staphylococcus shinii]|nr:hypothetical protein [Staphylococcus shinii]MDW8564688.1 hypothetical protein [Staphylococcus shinii]
MYADISTLSAQKILESFGRPDIVWASPDCTSYSIAGISHHRTKNEKTGNLEPKSEYAKFCDLTNKHMLKLIEELAPAIILLKIHVVECGK